MSQPKKTVKDATYPRLCLTFAQEPQTSPPAKPNKVVSPGFFLFSQYPALTSLCGSLGLVMYFSRTYREYIFQFQFFLWSLLSPDSSWGILCVHLFSLSVVCDAVQYGLSPTRLLCPWHSPGKKMGVECHFLLQGISPTQGWNPCLLHLLRWQADSFTNELPGEPLYLT